VVVGVTESHEPERRAWLRQACGEPWPCATRQDQLSDQYASNPLGLTMLMDSHLVEASAEIGDITAVELYQRLLGWARGRDHRADPPHAAAV